MFLLLLLLLPLAAAFPQMPMAMQDPGIPPALLAVLPPDAIAKLRAIHADLSLPPHMKAERIDAVMASLPDEVLDRLPQPPGFAQLPPDVQHKLKAISRNKALSFQEKSQQTRQIIESLPPQQRALLPGPPPPGFENLPAEARERLRAIHENTSLGFRERHAQIKQVIDSLPEDIRAKIPPPPPVPFA